MAGVGTTFGEAASGDKRDRARLAKLMKQVESGDVVLVTRLDLLDWRAARDAGPGPTEARAGPTLAPGALVVLACVDASCDIRRSDGVALATSLFGRPGVERAWGRIWSPGRRRTGRFAAPEAARAELDVIATRKRRRAYR